LPSIPDLCDLHKNRQSQASSSLLFFTVDRRSADSALCLLESQTTVQLQQLSLKILEKQLHKGREKEKA